MRNRKKHTLYIVLISSLSLFFLNSCSEDNAEKALKLALAELVSAVENKQYRSVTQKLTTHFRGNKRLNQQTMSALVFRYTLRHKFVKIYTVVNTIEVAKDKKEANMLFHTLLTGTKSTLPEHMRAFRVQSHWLKADNEWKIKEANWIEVQAQTVYPRIKNNAQI
ncbi:hypothetical protein MNBD_GAMMA23-1748 [hydrothermal vent metagenome]|uniref:DUF4440 domain-containing protein n=1 Tax=hydrothermal vent metagenome TaxID=652676 RepID=A0A3B1ADH7_9ZZZZ